MSTCGGVPWATAAVTRSPSWGCVDMGASYGLQQGQITDILSATKSKAAGPRSAQQRHGPDAGGRAIMALMARIDTDPPGNEWDRRLTYRDLQLDPSLRAGLDRFWQRQFQREL